MEFKAYTAKAAKLKGCKASGKSASSSARGIGRPQGMDDSISSWDDVLHAGPLDSHEQDFKDDSAKRVDPDLAAKGSGASASSSARGSAEFLSQVEGQRAIKVSV